MGRPPKDIDAETVFKLAKIGCTQQDVAEFFDCSHSVISERFRQDFHQGRAASKISLRRAQWRSAMKGSDRMLIHLGKVHLGQTDRLDVTSKSNRTMVYIERADNPRDVPLDLDAAIQAMGYGPRDTVVCLPAKERPPGDLPSEQASTID
jgi:hypothetical protein